MLVPPATELSLLTAPSVVAAPSAGGSPGLPSGWGAGGGGNSGAGGGGGRGIGGGGLGDGDGDGDGGGCGRGGGGLGKRAGSEGGEG